MTLCQGVPIKIGLMSKTSIPGMILKGSRHFNKAVVDKKGYWLTEFVRCRTIIPVDS